MGLGAYPGIGLGEVWGLGRASIAKLKELGARTVAEFVALPADLVRDRLTVTGLRTHAELQGVSCHPFNAMPGSAEIDRLHAQLRPGRHKHGRNARSGRRLCGTGGREVTSLRSARRRDEGVHAHQGFNTDPKYANQVTFALEENG